MLHGIGALDAVYADLKRLESCASQSGEELVAGLAAQKWTFESIEFRDVAFRYRQGKQDVLSGVSFKLRHGEAVGIVGPSGSGKSTLVDLILGLLEPTDGEILIDGRPARGVLRRWQAHIAYIPQQIFVLDDTIRRNVALGVLDKDIDERMLGEALRKARLGDFVAGLPFGLETRLGDRGLRLSGGQRQRIALARAIYHERDILILDEATSALDNELEAEIVEEVAGLKGLKTLIVIAHRLTTLRHCDRVIDVKGGSISTAIQATWGPTTRGP
jgi:ABC-type multidrug transport system fused ATPase/permease subunit